MPVYQDGVFLRIQEAFRSKSIRFKLLFYFLSLIIFLTLTLGIFSNIVYTRFIKNQTNTQIVQTIGQVNKNIEYYIANAEGIIRHLSEAPDVLLFLNKDARFSEKENNGIKNELLTLTSIHTEIAGIMIVNQSNGYISNEMQPISRDPLINEKWYQDAVMAPDKLHLFSSPIGRNIQTAHKYGTDEVVSITKAVRDPISGEINGVIVIDVSLEIIRQATENIAFGESGFLFVVDSAGKVVYAPLNDTVYRVNTDWLKSNDSGRIIRNIQGIDFEILYFESVYTKWKIVGVFSLPEVLAIVRSTQMYSIIVSLITLILAIIAAYFFTASIDKPLRKLRSLMKKTEEGDLNVAFNSRYQDEIGQLGNSFNNMIVKIRSLIDMVYIEQKNKREAELKTLQAQIKPHFLYNTLDTIQWLAQKHGATDIVEIVGSLSTLFRIGLSKGKEMIDVREEIEHIQSYLVIQKARYEDKISCEIEADESVMQLKVIKLILQPLVENAIYHGIKERRGKGTIWISIHREGTTLVLSVRDNGVGMSPEKVSELTAILKSGQIENSRIGYGIFNVNERIRLTYGNSFGLSILSTPGQGTTVEIRHPIVEG